MRHVARFFGFLFATGALVFVVVAVAAAVTVWKFEKDLPDYTQLKTYEPPVMTRVQAGDGSLLAEYSRERRLYLPSTAIPPLVKEAFISAEDKNFYKHNGVDPEGILRAVGVLVQGNKRAQGASTITQQVAKNFLLTNERSFTRKIREALLALRIEQAYPKEKILELYLNEIYLGLGNYGIAAAALNYFDKSVNELSIAEVAYLAGLPKGPNNYQPFLHRDAAVDRRNYVLSRMAENGYISKAEADKARAEPLGINPRVLTPDSYAAGYFAEEVRRELSDRYGEKKLYEGGLSVRTTLDPKMQVMARKALVDGLVRYDEAHGFRGAIRHIDLGGDWGPPLATIQAFSDVQPWRLAVVLDGSDSAVRIGLQPTKDKAGEVVAERETAVLNLDGVRWTGKRSIRSLVSPGDVVYVAPVDGKPGQWRLQQVPEISGAIVAMDPYTGRVFAMVGGFSFDQSEFNRATQALRQPGSSFKPFVYATALDNGYTPSSSVLDAPIEVDQGPGLGIWRPQNDDDNGSGPHTLRYGVEHSRNLMTVRLAKDIGMPLIVEYAKRFGIYDELPPVLSMSLGAGETSVLRMVTAYSMLANGGKRIKPTLVDRIQDRWGNTIYRHDERVCENCDAATWTDQAEPKLVDKREQVIDSMTAYQITSILQGVISRGTGGAIKALNRTYLAGKTGTTNDAKDVWFVGYSADLAVGLYLGFDQPRSLGATAYAAEYAAPVFRDFMAAALKDKPDIPFRAPQGIKLITVDYRSGMRSNAKDAIIEAFKPGTAPPDSYVVIDGGAGRAPRGDASAGATVPNIEKAVDSGLY